MHFVFLLIYSFVNNLPEIKCVYVCIDKVKHVSELTDSYSSENIGVNLRHPPFFSMCDEFCQLNATSKD